MRNHAVPYRKWFTGKAHTIQRNAQELRNFCEWIRKNPEQLRSEYVEARKTVESLDDWKRETKNTVLTYYNYLKKKGYSINTARTCVSSVLAFYSQNCEKLLGITRELDPPQIPENEFIFTQDALRKMYYYGNATEKAWLSSAVCLGYSSVDFLALETGKIANLVKEAKEKHLDFIRFIGKTRTKTSIQPRSFLSPEAIDSLNEYLKILQNKYGGKLPVYLWNGATNDSLNDWLKALVKKANIEAYGKQVQFKGLRKFLYDVLARMDETVACVVTGKKVDASKITYRTSIDQECERVYRESYKLFCLNGDVTGKAKREQTERIEQLESALGQLEKENMTFRTRIDNLHTTTMNLESRLKEYGDLLANWVEFGSFDEEEKEAMRRTWNIREFSQEEKQWYHEVMTVMMDMQKEKGYLDEKDMKEVKRRLKPLLEKHEKRKESQC